jgi:nitrile hydratase
MAERFGPGDRVRTSRADPPHHTRVPRYIRGAVGTGLEHPGDHPRPDDRARGRPAPPQPVYTVRFAATDLFGAGEHFVTVDVWETHLRPAEAGASDER